MSDEAKKDEKCPKCPLSGTLEQPGKTKEQLKEDEKFPKFPVSDTIQVSERGIRTTK